MAKKIKLRVQGLTTSQVQSGAYALILAEVEGAHRIPVIVGTAEAQSIAIALERIVTPRPLTHDLFVTLTHSFGILVQEVFIYRFADGVFYSELVLFDGERQVRIDSRTSDAIAIALRLHVDIYTTDEVVKECGLLFDDSAKGEEDDSNEELSPIAGNADLLPSDFDDQEKLQSWLSSLSESVLAEKLDEAIASENYEYAKVYQEELSKRKNK